MALTFPSNPTLNQVYSTGSLSWTWNGKSWNNGTSILATSNLVSSSVQFTNGNTTAFDTNSNITVGQITASFAKISGSIFGTASFATNAFSASYAPNIYVLPTNVVSSSAQLSNNGGVAFDTNTNITVGQITASFAKITNLTVQYITSSVLVITGSNKFGDASNDTQEFTGSVNISGSLSLVGNVTSNNVLSLASGTVALPSLILSTDTTSGMYRIGANNIGISISAAKVLDISSTGLSVTGTLSASGGYNGTVGATTPSTGAFTTLSTNNTATFNGSIGGTTGSGANTVSFTATAINPTANYMSILAPNLTGQVGMGFGKSISSGNSGFIHWDAANTRLTLETYGSASPIYLNGSSTSVNGALNTTVSTSTTGTIVQFNTLNPSSISSAISIGTYPGFDSISGTHIRAYTNHGSTGDSSLAFEVNGTSEKMRITSTGNVGIGTTSPAALLHVYNTATAAANVEIARLSFAFSNTASYGGALNWATNGGTLIGRIAAESQNAGNNVDLVSYSYYSNTLNERLRLNINGLQATGVSHSFTAPSGSTCDVTIRSPYVVSLNQSASSTIAGSVTGGNFAAYLNFKNEYTGNTSQFNLAMASGYLFFYRGGSAQYSGYLGPNGTPLSFYGTSGGVVGTITTDASNTYYNTSSDYRLKDITGPLTDSGAFIDALKPKIGTWKIDGSKFVGFIAHEFAEVAPSSVRGEKDAVDADGNPVYQAMQASSAEVIANLVAELQSVRARLAALEAK